MYAKYYPSRAISLSSPHLQPSDKKLVVGLIYLSFDMIYGFLCSSRRNSLKLIVTHFNLFEALSPDPNAILYMAISELVAKFLLRRLRIEIFYLSLQPVSTSYTGRRLRCRIIDKGVGMV